MATERGTVESGSRRYEQVAARIGWLIEQGTLPAGGRVPSVRALSQQQRVSVSTVVNRKPQVGAPTPFICSQCATNDVCNPARPTVK